MAIATFHQLLTVYDEQLKKFFPARSRLGIVAIIHFLKDGPLTQTELIERTGLRQPRVSGLLKMCRALGIVKPRKVHHQPNKKEALTAAGRRRVAELEAALAAVLATTAVRRTSSAQAAPVPEEPFANKTPASPKTVQPVQPESEEVRHTKRLTRNWEAYVKRQAEGRRGY